MLSIFILFSQKILLIFSPLLKFQKRANNNINNNVKMAGLLRGFSSFIKYSLFTLTTMNSKLVVINKFLKILIYIDTKHPMLPITTAHVWFNEMYTTATTYYSITRNICGSKSAMVTSHLTHDFFSLVSLVEQLLAVLSWKSADANWE